MSDAALLSPTQTHAQAEVPSRLALLLHSLRSQAIFFVIPVFYMITTTWLLYSVPEAKAFPLKGLVNSMITITVPAGLVAVFFFRIGQYAFVIKPDSPSRQMIADIKALFRTPSRLYLGIPMLVAMVIFNKSMLELKPMIPVIKPFSWDLELAEWDRMLFCGRNAWEVFHPVLSHDVITFVINNCYNFWFLALFGSFIWFGFSTRQSVNRTQFFLAYMMAWWIGGGLMAVYFSSAGPVYFGKIGLSPDPFSPLMTYLYGVDARLPIWALDTQELLWDGYTGAGHPIGISAFPSLHNASALIFAFATWRLSRGLGIAFAVYTAIIFVGSIHLGWHYAVDGLAGLALAAVCWWVAGIAARWHDERPEVQKLNEGLASHR